MPPLVTFGEAVLRLSPPGTERLETAAELAVQTAGPESNVAIAAQRLGTDSAWLSTLPDTTLGRRVLADVRRHGVEPAVVWDDGRQGLAFVERAGPPRGTVPLDDRSAAAIEDTAAEELPVDRIAEAAAFYTTGVTPARSSTLARTTAALLTAAQEANTTAAFGVRYRRNLWSPDEARETLAELLPAVDVLVASEGDARVLTGSDGAVPELAHALASEWDLSTVAITRGDRGGVAWDDATVYERAAPETETADAAGAEDAFAGAFLAGRLSGLAVDEMLADAVAAAALARTIRGAVPTITRAEVDRVAAVDADG